MTIEFKTWPKTPRLFRDITITEKIDGTNSAVQIHGFDTFDGAVAAFYEFAPWDNFGALISVQPDPGRDLTVSGAPNRYYAVVPQSRSRIIDVKHDNHGFAKWVDENVDELVYVLGEGVHYGEWWGSGIQRKYGLTGGDKRFSLFNVNRYGGLDLSTVPGLGTVPVLHEGPFSAEAIRETLDELERLGSVAAPGFMRPEGIIVYHSSLNGVFKVTLENDGVPKSVSGKEIAANAITRESILKNMA